MTDTEAVTVAALTKYIVEDQAQHWHELDAAIRRSVNGVWSMEASNEARTIVAAARLVGPSEHGSLPYGLVAGGVYEAVLAAGGVPVEMPDEAEWQRFDELMSRHGITRATAIPAQAATVAMIRTPRETYWIAGGDE